MIGKTSFHSGLQHPRLLASLYFQGQFRHYHRLWLSLSPLEQAMERLWSCPGDQARALQTLTPVLRQARLALRRHALVMTPGDCESIAHSLKAMASHPALKKPSRRLTRDQIQAFLRHNEPARADIRQFNALLLPLLRAEISALEA